MIYHLETQAQTCRDLIVGLPSNHQLVDFQAAQTMEARSICLQSSARSEQEHPKQPHGYECLAFLHPPSPLLEERSTCHGLGLATNCRWSCELRSLPWLWWERLQYCRRLFQDRPLGLQIAKQSIRKARDDCGARIQTFSKTNVSQLRSNFASQRP